MAKLEAKAPARSLVRIPYTARHHGRDLGPFSVAFTIHAPDPKEVLQVAMDEFFAYRRRSFHTAVLYPDYERITLAFAGGKLLPVPKDILHSLQTMTGPEGLGSLTA
ncbi:MAG: hypothetical protein HYT87_14895 [Nitrospirae bacterium]|nr:hypothetical protein [Nitrospirota bacterium]